MIFDEKDDNLIIRLNEQRSSLMSVGIAEALDVSFLNEDLEKLALHTT